MANREIIEKIRSAHVMEQGVYAIPLADKLEENIGAPVIVAALNNADVDGVFLQLLKKDPAKILEGLNICKDAIGAENAVIQLPEYAASMAEQLQAKGAAVQVGLINVRANAGNMLTHLASMADVADAFRGTYTEGVYVSVNGGAICKVSADTKLKDLVSGDIKGFQTGYVFRGSEALDMTVAEAQIENGVLNALTSQNCVVDLTEKQLTASRKQSCGKCVFCREGLIQLQGMQKDITVGKGRLDELDLTKEIGEAMTYSTPCSMGQNCSRLALSAVEVFRSEYEEHIKKHKCSADVCLAFRKVYIDPMACTGCASCIPSCPVDAIDGAEGYIHVVFDHGCTRCGKCVDACPEKAIHVTTGTVPKLPKRMMKVGRFK
ncbi:MAG: 4Fe-4S binding protein [Lachnospiraceae bacterium]|nr:4Fe-4S binding protein [Lachnospiraceae bacterium]